MTGQPLFGMTIPVRCECGQSYIGLRDPKCSECGKPIPPEWIPDHIELADSDIVIRSTKSILAKRETAKDSLGLIVLGLFFWAVTLLLFFVRVPSFMLWIVLVLSAPVWLGVAVLLLVGKIKVKRARSVEQQQERDPRIARRSVTLIDAIYRTDEIIFMLTDSGSVVTMLAESFEEVGIEPKRVPRVLEFSWLLHTGEVFAISGMGGWLPTKLLEINPSYVDHRTSPSVLPIDMASKMTKMDLDSLFA